MKVLLLSDTYSEHTEKWAIGLADKGVQIGLFSFNKASYEWYNHPNVTVFFEPEKKINAESTLTKLSYLKYVTILKKIIRHFKPDILHAHYATSYGLVGALLNFRPFFLSVWGSDVYDFPTRSKLHKRVFQYNLKKATCILSTSEVMRDELKKYTSKPVIVTPFGVDVDEFSNRPNAAKQKGVLYVGTIKPIEVKYGIIHIIEAAEMLVEQRPDLTMKFLLIGDGNDLDFYRDIINSKKLNSVIELTGRIPFSEISAYHNLLDIFLNVSIDDSESFGVATVEAMACEKPVIVTDVGGLMEVVNKGEVGLVIPRKDSKALAAAILKLVDDNEFAKDLGKRARQRVLEKYNWKNNLRQMEDLYEQQSKGI
jgi:glycosyltransferase involved in cell wall biosynthesis